jgi:outer membrane protein assembly factor BamA
MRRAGVELERSFPTGVLTRVEAGAAIQQRENPAYDVKDRRRRFWLRGERAFGRLKVGTTAGWQGVTFAGEKDSFRSIGADATLDTRLDPVLPRNAVYVTASLEHLSFESSESLRRTRVDARGFIGLFGQHVLMLRALREDASQPVPLYLRSLLGGWSNLRGFEAGFETGDTLVAWSAEWRVPITSPLSVGKLGVSAFVDWGTAYDKGERYRDQTLHQGAGASVWLAITGFRLSVAVAHGKGAGTRFSFGGGLTF